jgi:hypothetical protein
MCGLLFDDWTYLDACETGDLHTAVARMTWPDLGWTGDIRKDRKIAERPFHRHYSYRDACKRLGHGANFLGKPPALSKGSGVPIAQVKVFVEKYFTAFPCLPKWQSWTAGELQRTRRLTSIHGRTRDFFDRTDADETVRKALAYLAAAATADNLNLGMWRVWRYMPEVQLLAQVHDAIYFQFDASLDHREVVGKAQKLMEVPLVRGNRRFVVPTEAKLGLNWGNHVPADPTIGQAEGNLKGLRKFKP